MEWPAHLPQVGGGGVSPLKCAFRVWVRNFLGFLVHQREIEVDHNKEKAITSAKAPQNQKVLQSSWVR